MPGCGSDDCSTVVSSLAHTYTRPGTYTATLMQPATCVWISIRNSKCTDMPSHTLNSVIVNVSAGSVTNITVLGTYKAYVNGRLTSTEQLPSQAIAKESCLALAQNSSGTVRCTWNGTTIPYVQCPALYSESTNEKKP